MGSNGTEAPAPRPARVSAGSRGQGARDAPRRGASPRAPPARGAREITEGTGSTGVRPCRCAPPPRLRARRREGGAGCLPLRARCSRPGSARAGHARAAALPRRTAQNAVFCAVACRLRAAGATVRSRGSPQNNTFCAVRLCRPAARRRAPPTEVGRQGARGRPAAATVPCGAEGGCAAPHCPAGQREPRLRAREPTAVKRSGAPPAGRRAKKRVDNTRCSKYSICGRSRAHEDARSRVPLIQ